MNNIDLNHYRRIVLLTDGFSTPFFSKTAISLLRYRRDDITAVLDRELAGQDAAETFGTGAGIPIVDAIPDDADAVFIGIAPPGGKLPQQWRSIICESLRRGIDVVSGLHEFLSDDDEFVSLSSTRGAKLVDVRRNSEKETATAVPFRDGCLRVHTVGQDCSVGKMVTTIEIQRELASRDLDAKFIATGQTGIMISGDGIPVDCVVADFINGAVERLVRRNEQHDILLIEGQGSISHPRFSAVTLGLLHGCVPHGLIFCYEAGREAVKGLGDVPLLGIRRLLEAYESAAGLRHPCRVIGIAMNSRNLSATAAADERKRITDELGLPTCDVYRNGPGPLASAVLELQGELFS